MKFLFKFALAAALFCLVLGVGEWLALRLDPQYSFRGLHRLRPDAGWLYDLTPGATGRHPGGEVEYTIAAHGFRDRERVPERKNGAYRIAILGDSVTFGYGVAQEEGFVARLEALFGRELPGEGRAARGVEVLNFGVSGYNPFNEAKLLDVILSTYRPDLVLVQFCINDLNDPRVHFGASTNQAIGKLPRGAFPNPERQFGVAAETSTWERLCARSRLCGALAARVAPKGGSGVSAADFRETFAVRVGPEFEAEFAWLGAAYTAMNRRVRAAGGSFAVLVFPHLFQLQFPDLADIGPALRALGEQDGFQVIELLKPFQDEGIPPSELFFDPWHPTAKGHEIAADAIHGFLQAQILPANSADPANGQASTAER